MTSDKWRVTSRHKSTGQSAGEGAGGAAGVDEQVDGADGCGDGDEESGGDVGVDGRVEIVEEEGAVVGRDAGAGFAPVFGGGERAGRGGSFGDDAPDDGGDVQRGEPGASAGEERAENHPGDVNQVRGEQDAGEEKIGSRSHAAGEDYIRDDAREDALSVARLEEEPSATRG